VIVEFNYYLHDNYQSDERTAFIANQCPELNIQNDADLENFGELIGKPFYEVTLKCQLDTDTGKITVLETTL
jgi:hypothetical protein